MKPVALVERAIRNSSKPRDTVLDCFGGSGSTALAALKLGRRTVSMEIESKWVTEIAARIQTVCEAAPEPICTKEAEPLPMRSPKRKEPQFGLFEMGK